MDARDAGRLIQTAVHSGERWADLGAGTGTFTVALAELLGPSGTVYAIERAAHDVRALQMLVRTGRADMSPIVVIHEDFTRPLKLPPLDGALLANALHFVSDVQQAPTLRQIASNVVAGGAIVVVEYDNRPRSQWVPYPIARSRLTRLAHEAGLGSPEMIGEQRSAFGGTIYTARMARD
jgi:tRNA A58 N-methylase Trm61